MSVYNLDTHNWYYVQAFPVSEDYEVAKTIVFATSKDKAIARVKEWLGREASIHLYHKNYVREARAMVQGNNYIVA